MTELADPTFLDDRLSPLGRSDSRRGGVHLPRADVDVVRSGTTAYDASRERSRRKGIGRGDVVSFLDKNHPACVELTMAASSLGAANAIINFRLAGDEVDYAVNDSGAKLLLVGSELMPLIEKIRDKLTTVEHVIEVTPDGGDRRRVRGAARRGGAGRPRPRGRPPRTSAW